MSPAVSKVMATVNAPYGVAVTPAELAARITDPESAVTLDHAVFAFLSEVSPKLQHDFIAAMAVDAAQVVALAEKFSTLVGYRLPLGHVDKWRSQSLMQAMSMKPRKLSAVLS